MSTFTGGKSGAGVWQRIINQIPPCEVFVSGFLGNCAVMRRMRLPAVAIGIEADLATVNQWLRNQEAVRSKAITLIHGCGLDWLDNCFVDSRFFPCIGRHVTDNPADVPQNRRNPARRANGL